MSQCADEIHAIEDSLRQFVVAVTESAASFIALELADDNKDPDNMLPSTIKIAADYLCNNCMPKNAPIPLCVAFVHSVEEKVEEIRRLIAKKHVSGKFNYPPYWSSIDSIRIK